MKKMRYFPVVLMLGLLVFLTSSTEPVGNQNDFAGRRGAQFHRGMHRGMNNGMNFRMFSTLTQEQKDQIKTIRTAQMKKALPLRNQINEQKAKLRTLTTGDKIDTKSAQKVLAKIEGLKTELAKQMVRNRLDIRNVLTEEQRIMFDARSSKMGQKGNGFKGKGRHGMKQGFGQGRPMPCAGHGGRGMQQGQRGMRQGQKGMGHGMSGGMGNGMTAGKGMRPGMKGGQGMMAGKGMGAGMKGRPGMMGAQRGMQGQTGLAWMKDLTQEQKDQLKALRLQEMKAMTRYKNQLDEYKAKLKTLTTSDNVNLKDVDKVIDQMGKIKLEMAKNKLSNRMAVRNLLTDDQKVLFDMHAMKGKGGRGKGMI
jgi:Spy/CpxP family protein refolding chaperone